MEFDWVLGVAGKKLFERARHARWSLDQAFPFWIIAGSGTTLIAAEKTGRRARLIEFDPAYCDGILRRFAQVTGKEARLAATGEGFEAVMESRGTSVSLSHERDEVR